MRRLLVLPVLMLGLLGCGGGDEALSKEEFVERGNTLCRELSNEFPDEQPESPPEFKAFLDTFGTQLEKFRDDVAALDVPDDGKELQADFIASIEGARVKIQEAEDAAAENDLETVAAKFDEADTEASKVNQQLEDYGLSECAE